MPPKVRITKEMVTEASVEIIRKNGHECVGCLCPSIPSADGMERSTACSRPICIHQEEEASP